MGRALRPAQSIRAVKWTGSARHDSLSYEFVLRWNSEAGERLAGLLSAFRRDDPSADDRWRTQGPPAVYSIVERRRTKPVVYELFWNDDRLALNKEPSALAEMLLWHVNTQTVRLTGSFLLVHAGAVCTEAGQGVLLPAPSGSGKTTFVAGLVRGGFAYLSEEIGAIDPVLLRLHPYPRPMNLRARSRALFRDVPRRYDPWWAIRDWCVHAEDIRPDSARTEPCPLAAVVAHRFEPGAPTRLEPITAARTAYEIGRNLMNLRHYGRRVVPLLERIVAQASGYRLVWGDLGDAVAAVKHVTERKKGPRGAPSS
jgi:hypothetical protein